MTFKNPEAQTHQQDTANEGKYVDPPSEVNGNQGAPDRQQDESRKDKNQADVFRHLWPPAGVGCRRGDEPTEYGN